MNDLTWSEIARLGISVALDIINGNKQGDSPVTDEEWEALLADVNESFEDRVGPRPNE